jgi:antitoxin CcdA
MAMTSATPKRRLNVSVRGQLIDAARAAGLNLSQVTEAALELALAEARRQAWERDHADAITAYADRIERDGMWSDGVRTF